MSQYRSTNEEVMHCMTDIDHNVSTSEVAGLDFMAWVVEITDEAVDEHGKEFHDPTVVEAIHRHITESIEGSKYLTVTHQTWATFTALALYQTDYLNDPESGCQPSGTHERIERALSAFAEHLSRVHLHRVKNGEW